MAKGKGAKSAIKQNVRKSKGVPKSNRRPSVKRQTKENVPSQRWNGPNVHRV